MRPSPVLLRAFEVLLDGEWHPASQVLLEASKVVPPGVAQRRVRELRESQARRSGRPVAEGTVAEDIRAGQRRIARELIHRAAARGLIEVNGVEDAGRRSWADPSHRVRLSERALKYAAEEVARASGSSAT